MDYTPYWQNFCRSEFFVLILRPRSWEFYGSVPRTAGTRMPGSAGFLANWIGRNLLKTWEMETIVAGVNGLALVAPSGGLHYITINIILLIEHFGAPISAALSAAGTNETRLQVDGICEKMMRNNRMGGQRAEFPDFSRGFGAWILFDPETL